MRVLHQPTHTVPESDARSVQPTVGRKWEVRGRRCVCQCLCKIVCVEGTK